jgi:hypothetical protein
LRGTGKPYLLEAFILKISVEFKLSDYDNILK